MVVLVREVNGSGRRHSMAEIGLDGEGGMIRWSCLVFLADLAQELMQERGHEDRHRRQEPLRNPLLEQPHDHVLDVNFDLAHRASAKSPELSRARPIAM